MIPLDVPLVLKKGDYFEMPVRLSERNTDGSFKQYLNLTTWDPAAMIRQTPTGSVMLTFSVFKENQTTLPGAFWIYYSKTLADSLVVTTATLWGWDLEIVETTSPAFQAGRRYTVMGGSVTVNDEYTHA